MASGPIATIARDYLQKLVEHGIPISYGVIFGSQASSRAHKWSDIDLLVISPQFDEQLRRDDISLLWRIAARSDSRIEPIAVGERQFEEDDSSAIIEIARREGQVIRPA